MSDVRGRYSGTRFIRATFGGLCTKTGIFLTLAVSYAMARRYYKRGDSEYVIPELVKGALPFLEVELDLDYDDPEYTCTEKKHITFQNFFTCTLAEVYTWYDDERDRAEYTWSEVPEELREQAIEEVKESFDGRIFALEVRVPAGRYEGRYETTFTILVEDYGLGEVRIVEVMLDGLRRNQLEEDTEKKHPIERK